jgi:hypothetical protein
MSTLAWIGVGLGVVAVLLAAGLAVTSARGGPLGWTLDTSTSYSLRVPPGTEGTGHEGLEEEEGVTGGLRPPPTSADDKKGAWATLTGVLGFWFGVGAKSFGG